MRVLTGIVGALALAVAACGSDGTPTAEFSGPVDLVYISDSTGFGVADRYGELVEEEFGVVVNVHDNATGNLQATTVLDRLQDGDERGWADQVRDAEIIVLFGNPRESGATSDLETCISASTASREPPQNYSAADWAPYRDLLDDVYARIWELRDGEPVVLRAVDFYNPVISAWEAAGISAECIEALESFNGTIRDAAEANGATLVSVADLFNGDDHTEDPREMGYIGGDGIHTSDEGAAAIAQALAAAGFGIASAP